MSLFTLLGRFNDGEYYIRMEGAAGYQFPILEDDLEVICKKRDWLSRIEPSSSIIIAEVIPKDRGYHEAITKSYHPPKIAA